MGSQGQNSGGCGCGLVGVRCVLLRVLPAYTGGLRVLGVLGVRCELYGVLCSPFSQLLCSMYRFWPMRVPSHVPLLVPSTRLTYLLTLSTTIPLLSSPRNHPYYTIL